MADGIGGPCRRCGVEHEVFKIHDAIGTPVLITDGPYAGQVGLASEVSRYGGPWRYRVIVGAVEACSQELRESFDPCQLRELKP